jgi:hypothetical protein
MPNAFSLLKSIVAVSAKMVFPACYTEEFQERAAILEFEGSMSRSDALLRSCDEINKRYLLKGINNG